jgi:predicted transposase/invertase (TIGR01784 family)
LFSQDAKAVRSQTPSYLTGFCFLKTKGETKGREAGKLEAKQGIARNLKTAGLTDEQIKAATGLTDSDLEKL